MPPISPNSSALINYHNEKKNVLQESQIVDEKQNNKDKVADILFS